MTWKEPVWEARKQVLFSYGHKAVLLLAAYAGFAMLQWLSGQKDVHDNQEWTVNEAVQNVFRDAIERVRDTATAAAQPVSTPPDGKQPMSHGEVQAAVGYVEPIPASACRDPEGSKKYTTREELIAAIQGRAEACVWAEFRGTVKKVRGKMAAIEHRESHTKAELEEDLKDYTSYANFITQEQSFAATKAGAVRQYVGTMLMSSELTAAMKEPEEKPDTAGQEGWIDNLRNNTLGGLKRVIRPTLADKSSLHVIYEIFWYASLLLGVGASSMLFVVILTAIPITNGEGYWTARIGKILDSVPSLAGRSIAVPLLAAAIGGGTLAGATAQTQPGGQARIPDDRKTTLDEPSALISSWSLVEGYTYVEGDTYNDSRQYGGTTTTPPPSNTPIDLTEVANRLRDLNQRTEELVKEAESTRKGLVAAVDHASDRISALSLRTQGVEEGVDQVQRTIVTARAAADDLLACANDLRAMEVQAKVTLNEHMKKTDLAAADVEAREKLQQRTFGQTLAQSTEYDTRPFLKRTFGRSRFHVGPAVQTTMAAHLENEEPSIGIEEKALLEALQGMREDKEPPLNRRDFEQSLRARLKTPPEDVKDLALKDDQIEKLMNKHRRTLLRICALPRR